MREPRAFAAIGALFLVLLLAGCGTDDEDSPRQGTTPTATAPEPVPDPPVSVDTEPPAGSATLSCRQRASMNIDYAADTGGLRDPVKAARQALGKRIEAGDRVERVRSSSSTPLVRVVRDGEVVAVVRFMAAENGGWLANQVDMCGDFAR
jgi:hypothetical protein